MDEHVEPQIAAQLHRYWPISVAQGTTPEEAQLVRSDIAFQRNREQFNDDRAMDLQIRQQAYGGGRD